MQLRGACAGGGDGATTNNSAITLTLPAGTQPGDVCVIASAKNTSADTASMPTGWRMLSGPDSPVSAHSAYCWGKVLDASDIVAGGATVTWSSGGRPIAVGVVYEGADQADPFGPIDVTTQGNVGTTLTLPTITTTHDGATVVTMVNARIKAGGQVTPATLPAAWTVDVAASTAYGSGVNFTSSAAHILGAAPGTYGGGTVALSPDSNSSAAYTLAILPAATSEDHEGGSTSNARATAAGAGAKAAAGGASSGASATLTGSGSKATTGGSTVDAAASTAAGGVKTATGGSSAHVTAATAASGDKSVTGGSTLDALATVTGGGEAHHPSAGEGGSSIAVEATAAGAGVKAALGGSTVTAGAAPLGAGAKAALGGSVLQAAAAAVAFGIRTTSGGGGALVTVTTTGGGGPPEPPIDWPARATLTPVVDRRTLASQPQPRTLTAHEQPRTLTAVED